MSERGGPAPREGTELTPPGERSPAAVGGGAPTPEEPSRVREPGVEILRSALGLLIGLAATGIGALLAEVTASRGARGERH